MMKFFQPQADVYIPDGAAMDAALDRTTQLCIAAHQDDIEIIAYPGIAACYHEPRQWFTGVVVTDGAGSSRVGRYADRTNEEMKALRRDEQRKAAHIGDYSLQVQLAYPSADVKNPSNTHIVSDLWQILDKARPEIVYLHNPADKHDTHIAVLAQSLKALRSLAREHRPKKVYGCEVWRSLDWLVDPDKQVLDASAYPNLASALVNVFDSQITGGKRYDLATIGRRLANATFYDSHASDESNAYIWAMDLTPLVDDATLSVVEYTRSFLDRFRIDVDTRLKKFIT